MPAGPVDPPGSRLLDLVAVVDRLRRECPWVRRQSHRSLVRYLLEETYETIASIEAVEDPRASGPVDADAAAETAAPSRSDWERHWADLREELGDVVFQVIFHSRIAAEHPGHPWTIDDVAAGITDKLIRRNPHVFGSNAALPARRIADTDRAIRGDSEGRAAGATASASAEATGQQAGEGSAHAAAERGAHAGAEEDTPHSAEAGIGEDTTTEIAAIEAAWDAAKDREKPRRALLEGVPFDLPALALADKILTRMERVGTPLRPCDTGEIAASVQQSSESSHDAVGESLLALVEQAHRRGIDAEQALRDALRRHLPSSTQWPPH